MATASDLMAEVTREYELCMSSLVFDSNMMNDANIQVLYTCSTLWVFPTIYPEAWLWWVHFFQPTSSLMLPPPPPLAIPFSRVQTYVRLKLPPPAPPKPVPENAVVSTPPHDFRGWLFFCVGVGPFLGYASRVRGEMFVIFTIGVSFVYNTRT